MQWCHIPVKLQMTNNNTNINLKKLTKQDEKQI